MYQTGDFIVYGETGVCRVERVSEETMPDGQTRWFYTLRPLYQTCTIQTPADNGQVFMRPVISRTEAERLVEKIPTLEIEPYRGGVQREAAEYYRSRLQNYGCDDLIRLTMMLYRKMNRDRTTKRKVSAVDERFRKRAEDLLFGELAVALDIRKNDVPDYIAQKTGAIV